MGAAAIPLAIAGGSIYSANKSSSASRSAAKTLANAPKYGFNTWGLNATPTGKAFDISRTPELTGVLNNISGAYGNQSKQIGGLLDQVKPGMGAVTNAAVNTIRNRRSQAIGNLRENLSRRRVLGSSFGQDAISRAEAEFAQQEAQAKAGGTLQELDMTNKLIQEQTASNINQFQTYLDQMNLETQVATQLASGVTTNLQANAREMANLQAQSAQGWGALSGELATPFLNYANTQTTNWLDSLGSTNYNPTGGVQGG